MTRGPVKVMVVGMVVLQCVAEVSTYTGIFLSDMYTITVSK